MTMRIPALSAAAPLVAVLFATSATATAAFATSAAPAPGVAKTNPRTAANAALQRVRLASPANVVSAAKSCSLTITANGTDARRLSAIGWRAAPVRGDAAAGASKPFRAYSMAGSPTIILLPSAIAARNCTVMSRLATAQDVALVANGLSGELGQKPSHTGRPGEALWQIGDRVFRLTPTGSPQAPGVRIAVTHRLAR